MSFIAGAVAAIRDRAAHTPAHRDRYLDLLRAVAICMVVVGHWLVTSIEYTEGALSGRNALSVLSWAHPLTLVFQVMPIFFLVGGFANARSLTSHLERGGHGVSWVLHRTGRLLRPTTVLFVTVPTAALVAVAAGAERGLVGLAAWMVSMPLWFLLAYLTMVVLGPWMYALHQRAGLAVPVVLALLVGICDLLRLGFGVPYVAESTYLIAWLAIHQLGFCWQDGKLPTARRVSLIIAVSGAATLTALIMGPYDVRMVGGNTNPPSLALLSLAVTQVGIVLLLRDAGNRWLARKRPWTGVVAINAVILTIFLWHMTAALAVALVAYPTRLLVQPEITSVQWWIWRLPWLALCALVLALLVSAFGSIELRGGRPEKLSSGVVRDIATMAALAAVLGGLLGVALAGPGYHGPGGLPPAAVLSYLAGAAVLRWLRQGLRRGSGGGERLPAGQTREDGTLDQPRA